MCASALEPAATVSHRGSSAAHPWKPWVPRARARPSSLTRTLARCCGADFCRECREQGKFCGKDVTTGCPDLSFLDWAEKHANQYTRHFSHAYVTADEYYDSYVHSFAGLPKLEDRDVDAAAAMLSGKIGHDVKLLWTEELDHGWHELAEWMPGTRVGAQLKQMLRTTDTSELHSNENDSTGRYWPTPQEKTRACGYNWADCQLYERLSGRKCQCGQ